MKRFEVGKSYRCFGVIDSDFSWYYKCVGRTKSMITLEDDRGELIKRRVVKDISEFREAESLRPLGNYSMCPVLSADREEEKS